MKNAFKLSGIIILCFGILLINSCKKKNPTPPVVTTSAVSAITQTTAICGGDVTSEGTDTVLVRGVCWNTTVNPVINDSHTTDGLSTASFVSNITGLSAYTAYHVRAYATNSAGTCLLYTSDAADEEDSVDLGGRRIIKKKKKTKKKQ